MGSLLSLLQREAQKLGLMYELFVLILMYEPFRLISMYELMWLNSAAIIIYYIYCTNGAILLYEYIFFDGKMAFTAGSIHKPAVLSTHHQRWVHSSPTVYQPAVMSPLITAGFETGGDDPSYHQRLKSNAPQTGGDAHFEPAVMGGAGVVWIRHSKNLDLWLQLVYTKHKLKHAI